MDFKDMILQYVQRIEKLRAGINTEEATKNAFIMPFLTILGYDVFNPMEVVPEYTCDIGTKKGEKIDYAILKDNEPIILIECKHCEQDLNLHDNQLLRYFNVSKAKFGVLTNGIVYRFYTDLEKSNIMDDKPFLEVNLLDLREAQIEELKKFHKSYFDVETILSSASELKYMGELKVFISKEFITPTTEFIKHFGRQVYDGQFTVKVLEQFSALVKRSISSYINDMISDRLKAAMQEVEQPQEQSIIEIQESVSECKIVTTEDELQAFYIIRGLLAKVVDVERVVYRDAQTYCAILLDDNNRKPLCRLYFNTATKLIAIFDEQKKETKHQITSLNEIYNYADELILTLGYYTKQNDKMQIECK